MVSILILVSILFFSLNVIRNYDTSFVPLAKIRFIDAKMNSQLLSQFIQNTELLIPLIFPA